MRRNVLIFSGGSYPGVEIYFCLQNNLLFNPISISSYSDHSEFLYKEYYTDLPYINEPNFIDKLNDIIQHTNSELIIPTHDTIALFLMQNESKINAKIVCSPLETTEICQYKSLTYSKLDGNTFLPYIFRKIGRASCRERV